MLPGFLTLHRMIFWELVRVFALSLVGMTGIFLIAGVIQQATQLGVAPGKLFQVIPLLIPSSLPYTVPATILFASCVAYGRLANDNEVVAMKAAGVDLLTILTPALLLGVLGTAGVAAVSWAVIPRSYVRLQVEITRDPEEFLYNQLKRERNFRANTSPFALYVRDVQGRRLVDVIVKRRAATDLARSADGALQVKYDYVARTREAELKVDLDRKVLTVDAKDWLVGSDTSQSQTTGHPEVSIDLPEIFSIKQIRSRPIALDWDELPGRGAEVRQERADIAAKREAARQLVRTSPDPAVAAAAAGQDVAFAQQLKDADRNFRNVEHEYHNRPALAASCLVFALIGCPVGIWFNRSDYLSTFVVCWIPTVLLYYPLVLAGAGLAKDGKVPIPVGVWGPNVVLGVLALLLTWRLVKR